VRVLLALFLSLFAIDVMAQTVPDKTPEDLVRYIYQQYVGKKGTDEFNFNWSDKPLVDRLFEPKLAYEIVKAGKSEEPIIDYDPFANGQDFEIKSYEIRTEQKSADRARIAADFVNFEAKMTVRYDMVSTKAGWRISDVSASDGSSLRKLLKMR
jgi:hypothetical protein